MSDRAAITRITELPTDFQRLVDESRADGFPALQRMLEEWSTAANRFAADGEALWSADAGGRLVGICGLNVDPYIADPTVGRLRHLYVALDARRQGTGRALVNAALEHAVLRFRVVRLRTTSPDAVRFYDALGFDAPKHCDDPTATHVWETEGPRPR